jgi:hypothetical protein
VTLVVDSLSAIDVVSITLVVRAGKARTRSVGSLAFRVFRETGFKDGGGGQALAE